MIVGSLFVFFHNYSYWSKYGGKDILLWSIAGASVVLLGLWIIITRWLLPPTVDPFGLPALSRHILFVVVGLFFFAMAFWEYVWNR